MKLDSTSYAFVKKVEQYLLSLPIELNNKKLLVALSGGVDSCVLLDVLCHLKKELEFEVAACHVNHKLRGAASNEDEAFVIQRTREYDIPLTVRRFDDEEVDRIHKGNLEEQARELRYQRLAHTAEELNYHYTATGHTKSDQAETVLHRMIRSSGLSGLSGIHPVCSIHQNTVIRPLLCHSLKAVMEYADLQKLSYRHDEMNDDPQFTRVKIRNELLPLLKQDYNPKLEDSLAKLANVCHDEEVFWEDHLNNLSGEFGSVTEDNPGDRNPFLKLSRAEQRRLMRFWLKQWNVDSSFIPIDDAIHLLASDKPQAEIHFSTDVCLIRRYDQFFFGDKQETAPMQVNKPIPVPGKIVIPELHIEVLTELVASNVIQLGSAAGWQTTLDYALVKEGLFIRTWQEGDRIQPLGMEGTKPLKKIWQENKIPLEKRNSMPILCHQHEIVWIPGCCESENYKITDETEMFVQITIQLFR